MQSSRLNKRGLYSLINDFPVKWKHTRVFASKTRMHSRASSLAQLLGSSRSGCYFPSQQALWLPRHNITNSDWKRGSMMRHADPLLSALVLGRQKWRALIGLEKILVVIVTANREHALSWDVMNSAVPLPCGGYLLRNVFLEDSLCVVMMMMLRGSSLWKRQWTIH